MKKKTIKRIVLIILLLLVLAIIAVGAIILIYATGVTVEEAVEIANENAPIKIEQQENIQSLEKGDKEDTWAFYIYMNGSDLEGAGYNNLSDFTALTISDEVNAFKEASIQKNKDNINDYLDTIKSNDGTVPTILTLPSYFKDSGDSGKIVPGSDDNNTVDEYWLASTYIEELKELDIPENIKIIIQPGGALAWKSVDINPNITQRFEIVNHNLVPVYEGPLQNMGKAETLSDFLTFCNENYPADKTVAILWDHGGATRGFGWDEIFGNDNLTLAELREGFEGAFTLDEENPPIDLLYLNACLMSCAETYDYLRGVSEYTLAHQEIGYAGFRFYTDAFIELCQNPDINPAQFASRIVDSFISQLVYVSPHMIRTTSMAVLDSDKASYVYDLYADFAKKLLADVIEDPYTMTILTRASKATNAMAISSYKGYNTYDLYGFAEYLSPYYPEECAAIMNAIDESVLYYRGTNYHNDSHGISIYFPAYIEDISCLAIALDYINSISLSDDIKALYYYKIAGCLPDEMQQYLEAEGYAEAPVLDFRCMLDFKKISPVINNEDKIITFDINEEILEHTADLYVQLGRYNEDSGYIEYLGQDRYAFVTDELDAFGIKISGDWVKINGIDFPVTITDATEDYIKYLSKVDYLGDEMNLVLQYDGEKMSLIDIQPYTDVAETFSRLFVDIQDGDKVKPIYTASDIYGRVRDQVKGKAIVIDGDIVIEDAPLKDGTYYIRAVAEDIRGDKHYSQIIQFEVENNNVTEITPAEFILMSPVTY